MKSTSWFATLSALVAVSLAASIITAPGAAIDNSPKHQHFLQSQAVAVAASRRPQVRASPKSPRLPIPSPPERTGPTGLVQSHGGGQTDDAAYVLAALRECNDGGRVVFARDQTYVVGKAMDLTFLRHIDIGAYIQPSPGGYGVVTHSSE